MKIAYLSSSPVPSFAANSIHVARMCEAFKANGHEVTLVARRGRSVGSDLRAFYGLDTALDVQYFRWPVLPGGGILFGASVGAYLLGRRSEVDLAYARCPYSAVAAAQLGLTLIYEAHALPRTRFHAWMERRILRSKSLLQFVVVSGVLKEDYEVFLKPEVARTRVVVAHDAASVEDSKEGASPLCRSTSDRRANVVYTGSLFPGKGAEVVVALAARLPDVDFHVVGGPEKLSLEYSRLAPPNLVFHGSRPPSAIRWWQQAADVLLLPNQRRVETNAGRTDIGRWTSPLKLFEYMAADRPIVASDLPVLREVLVDEENALLVDPEDINQWVGAVSRLCGDRELGRILARHAKARLLAEHTWRDRAARVLLPFGSDSPGEA